ncbi:MAG: C4-dicarboxylate ABC transporter substrate-binding protein [Flavobacteriaceae bacterium]|nr:C4-dicarboxylate ABC transporter substrate-binding protein [Flavobacteriaceae bacterium]
MKKILSLIASLAVVVTFSVPTASVSAAEFISIGTGGPTGVYFVVGNSVCRMVHKEAAEGRKSGRKHGLRCAAPSTGGSNYNIGQIKEGELQFGVAQSDWQYHAYNGSSKWEDNQYSDLRAVFSVHPEPFQLIAGKDSGISSWDDLKGKIVNIGNPGSGQRGTMEVLMAARGMSIDDFKQATELTSSEQVNALCDGKVDAIAYTVGVPNGAIGQAIDGCGASFVNLDSAAEQKLVNDNPYYAFANIPAGTFYKSQSSDATTFGVMATFVSSASVSDDIVYEVVRAVFENLDDFRKLHPAFTNLDPKQMISNGLSAPLHDGAVKYYKEQGWM